MDRYHFFISRYAPEEKHASYVVRAVESIIRIYPGARITVVDDGSPPELAYEPPADQRYRVDVVQNPYPRSGELGTLAYARTALSGAKSESSAGAGADDGSESSAGADAEAVAVTMHDTMVLIAPLKPLRAPADVRFLWHFDRFQAMHLPTTLKLMSVLPAPGHALHFVVHDYVNGFNRTWRGCFGMALVATKRALDRMHDTHGLFDDRFIRAVDSREARQAAERIVGLVAHLSQENKGALLPSLCGCIFDNPDPWKPETGGVPLDTILQTHYQGPFYKTWAGR
jgi:hypothetical protein